MHTCAVSLRIRITCASKSVPSEAFVSMFRAHVVHCTVTWPESATRRTIGHRPRGHSDVAIGQTTGTNNQHDEAQRLDLSSGRTRTADRGGWGPPPLEVMEDILASARSR
eukprot:1783995-Prymnesium_polylepis.1